MNNYTFNPKNIAELQKEQEIIKLLTSSSFQSGDAVHLKGQQGPIMVVTSIQTRFETILYQRIERISLIANVVYYSKGRSEFTSTSFPLDCLEKVIEA